MNAIIEIQNVSLFIGDKAIFSNISFDIATKDVIGIMGTNGSGKTSLVRMILGFDNCKSGLIRHTKGRFYGYVPQYFHPIASMNITVLEFLKLTKTVNLSLNEVVELSKIGKLLQFNLNSLSGGELRKVLMAKALLFSKDALFLDEPTCWLDRNSQQEFYSLISHLNTILTCAIVLISHDPFFKEGFFSKIIKL